MTRAWFGASAALLIAGSLLAVAPARGQGLPDGTPLCGIAAPAPSAPTPVSDDGRLRIVTLNLLHSESDEGDESLGDRLPLAADAIVRADADVVGAQEVTRNLNLDEDGEYPQKHGLVAERLAQAVADRSGEAWSWCWSLSNPHVPGTPDILEGGGNPLDQQAAAMGNFPDSGDFADGVAILTRFPIDHASFRRLLPRSYEALGCTEIDPFCNFAALMDSRQVLFARIDAPAGGLDFFTTHVAHHLTPLSTTTKTLQAQQIVDIIDEKATPGDALPDVLTGDFNSVPGSDAVEIVEGAGFVDSYAAGGGAECVPETGEGGCSGGPDDGAEVWTDGPVRPMDERIDYVFVRPPSGCELSVPSTQRIADSPSPTDDERYLWPSDHYGFVSEPACAPATDAPAPATPPADVDAAGGGRLPATGATDLTPLAAALLAAALLLRPLHELGRSTRVRGG